jgi:hypothetical protein
MKSKLISVHRTYRVQDLPTGGIGVIQSAIGPGRDWIGVAIARLVADKELAPDADDWVVALTTGESDLAPLMSVSMERLAQWQVVLRELTPEETVMIAMDDQEDRVPPCAGEGDDDQWDGAAPQALRSYVGQLLAGIPDEDLPRAILRISEDDWAMLSDAGLASQMEEVILVRPEPGLAEPCVEINTPL